MPDYVVIGAGLIGMLTARELARSGGSVVVLEKGEGGRESSWAGGGILSPLYPWRYPDAVTALAHWSQGRFPALAAELAADTGIDPEWDASGLLMVDVEAGERRNAVDWAVRFGYRVELLAAEAVRRCEPEIGKADTGVWMPDLAQVRNPRLLHALRADLARRGVEVRVQTPVTGFSIHGGKISGVQIPAGQLDAEVVVVAGGAWSGELLGFTGLHLPVEPVRGQMILFKGPPGLVRHIILGGERYVIPRRDGRILTGSTMERTGFDKVTTGEALAELQAAASALIPALGSLPIEAHWAGLRPGSPTGVPFVGPHPTVQGLFVNAGHFRNGVVTAPASARLLADLVLGREPTVDPAPYRPVAAPAK